MSEKAKMADHAWRPNGMRTGCLVWLCTLPESEHPAPGDVCDLFHGDDCECYKQHPAPREEEEQPQNKLFGKSFVSPAPLPRPAQEDCPGCFRHGYSVLHRTFPQPAEERRIGGWDAAEWDGWLGRMPYGDQRTRLRFLISAAFSEPER